MRPASREGTVDIPRYKRDCRRVEGMESPFECAIPADDSYQTARLVGGVCEISDGTGRVCPKGATPGARSARTANQLQAPSSSSKAMAGARRQVTEPLK